MPGHDWSVSLCSGYGAPVVVPRDVRAYMWFNLAGLTGSRDAIEARDMVGERMTADEIVEAHRLTREWRPHGQE